MGYFGLCILFSLLRITMMNKVKALLFTGLIFDLLEY